MLIRSRMGISADGLARQLRSRGSGKGVHLVGGPRAGRTFPDGSAQLVCAKKG